MQHRLESREKQLKITVVKDYQDLPIIECYPGPLNQVFMNILVNAIDALEENKLAFQKNNAQIQIRTSMINSDWIQIAIADNGLGIPEKIQSQIFDPFFTTKPVGKGTGMGMSISYQIITHRHGGNLECISTPGQGTEFIIKIPIKPLDS